MTADRYQIGPHIIKKVGRSWAIGVVVPRVINGRRTEEIRGARYYATLQAAQHALWLSSPRLTALDPHDLTPGSTLVRWRLSLGATQAAVAAESNVSIRQLRDIEHDRADPLLSTHQALVRALMRMEDEDA